MIRVRTAKSVYQIRKGIRAFRRIGGTAGEGAPPLGVWRAFEQMGPIIVGRPLRFFLSLSGNSRQMSRVRTLTTSPVVEIIDESADSVRLGHGIGVKEGKAITSRSGPRTWGRSTSSTAGSVRHASKAGITMDTRTDDR